MVRAEIPSKAHYILEEWPWIGDHAVYMTLELKRDVDHLEAVNDFETGYEKYDMKNNIPLSPPNPNFKDHRSKRDLTWHQEFNIWYWHSFSLPALKDHTISLEKDRHFVAKQYWDLKRDYLLNLRPYCEIEHLLVAV